MLRPEAVASTSLLCPHTAAHLTCRKWPATQAPFPRPRARSAPSVLARIGAFVALTKPRIIELLLVTTVPTMVVAAGGVAFAAAGGGDSRRRHPVGRRRQRRQHVPRPRHRRSDAADLAPSARHWRVSAPAAARVRSRPGGGRLFDPVVRREPALGRAGAVSRAFLRVRLHRGPEAQVTSKHRHRRSGRRGPGPGGLGRSPGVRSGWAPLVLFALVFLWTPPHFWALAIRYRDDYASAHVPMMPVVEQPRAHRSPDLRVLAGDGCDFGCLRRGRRHALALLGRGGSAGGAFFVGFVPGCWSSQTPRWR